jgi:predicted nuclease of predicted toxin-antitoxin system
MTTLWVDAQLPPSLSRWVRETFGVDCLHVANLGLAGAGDIEIARRAVEAEAIVLTKDADFAAIVHQYRQPAVVWLRIGNCTNVELRVRLISGLPGALELVSSGEKLVEI